MNVPLDRKTVRMERHIGSDMQQVVVESTLSLPAGMPDIHRIVRLEARPVVTDRSPLEDEIVVGGAVDFILVYAHDEEVPRRPAPVAAAPPRTVDDGTEISAERGYDADEGIGPTAEGDEWGDEYGADAEQPEFREGLHRHRWRRGAGFEAVFDMPGTHADVVVEARAEPLDIDVHLHNNGRGVDLEAVLGVGVRVGQYESEAVAVKGKQFPEAVDADERTVAVEHVAYRGRTNISVEGVLPLSSETPARTVVHLQASVRVEDAAVEGDEGGPARIAGKGVIDYKAVVTDSDGGVDAYEWTGQTPFSFTLETTSLHDFRNGADLRAEAEASVRGLDAAPTQDGRGVQVFADVDVVGTVAAVVPLELVVGIADADGKEVRFRTEAFGLEQWIGQQSREGVTEGQLDLPPGYPPVERLLGAEAGVRVEDVLVLGDKVIVEGRVDVAGLYVARTDGSPIHYVHWNGALPLEAEVPLSGAEPGMEADVRIDVVDVDLDLLNRETVEATVRVSARAKVTHGLERDAVVEAVVVSPPEANPPTLTFVVVQQDDTLWKLSHRYHTDVAAIVAANPWLEDPEAPLPPGRKLCVPRRAPLAPSPV